MKVKLETLDKMGEDIHMTDKQMAMEALEQLPETASFQQIKEEIEIITGLKHGLDASKANQVRSSSEVKEMAATWFTK